MNATGKGTGQVGRAGAPVGIIASTLGQGIFSERRRQTKTTPFGDAEVSTGVIGECPVVLIERYGPNMAIPSHKVNFRANTYALRSMGVRQILSQNAIGSLRAGILPGDIVVPHDIIDHTKARPLSLFDAGECWVRVDMTAPFCERMRKVVVEVASDRGLRVVSRGVFVCTEGPRLETPAEVEVYRHEGGDIVGTPMVPEAVMAREAEMCYASISPVLNFAAGLTPAVDHAAMMAYYAEGDLQERTEALLEATLRAVGDDPTCSCRKALERGFHGRTPGWMWPDSSLSA